MPARPPIPFPILLAGGVQLALPAGEEPTDTPTRAPGLDQTLESVARPTPGPGYTRAPDPAA